MDDGMMQEGRNNGDENLYVKFYMGAIKDEEKSAAEGHPVYRDTPFVKILVPGDKNTVIDTTADKQYQMRFPRLWQQFTAQETQTHSGMPIKEWPVVTRGQAEELLYLNIHTVEQLAACADSNGSKLMNFHALKAKAQAYLEAAKGTAGIQALAEENRKLKEQMAMLQKQMAEYAVAFSTKTARNENGEQFSSGSNTSRSK
jgi:hypothetical protein